MSSHADTIRQRLAEGEGCISSQFVVGQDEDDELGREFDEARAALDALLAENQQLREALRQIIGVKHDPNRVATELQDLARAARAAVGEE